MKKLLIISSFVIAPLLSGVAFAGGCEHGHYAEKKIDNEDSLIAKETDPELLELLKKQREKEVLQSPITTYN